MAYREIPSPAVVFTKLTTSVLRRQKETEVWEVSKYKTQLTVFEFTFIGQSMYTLHREQSITLTILKKIMGCACTIGLQYAPTLNGSEMPECSSMFSSQTHKCDWRCLVIFVYSYTMQGEGGEDKEPGDV